MSAPTEVSKLSEASVRLCEALAVLNMLMDQEPDNADGISAAITLINVGKDIIDSENIHS